MAGFLRSYLASMKTGTSGGYKSISQKYYSPDCAHYPIQTLY
jgi:hypothetical protein